MLHPICKLLAVFIVWPVAAIGQNFGGNPSMLKWKQVNTPQSRVIYPHGIDSQAARVSSVIHLLDTATAYSIGNKRRKWNVVLQNQTTNSNAYVRLAPVISELYMTPDQNNFSSGSLRWDDNLVIHEQRHMQQFANFNNGLTRVFSFLLGQEGQLLANGITIPDYFFEGDAVWQETLVSSQGRGRMPAFFNGMKSLWLGNKQYNWMKLRSGSLKHYTPDHYELGYQLVAYGYEKYGDQFWKNVTQDAVRFKGLFYAFNKAIQKYSGKSYQAFRQDAMDYFKNETLPATTSKQPVTNYITSTQSNNVIDYLFPQFVNNDTIVVTRRSYNDVNAFYLLVNGRQEKLKVKDYVTDDYFSYRNGKIVYAAFQSDARWGNRDYSVVQVYDIYSRQQKQLTTRSKYFSPDINEAGNEVLAVAVNTSGECNLHRLDAATGKVMAVIPNPAHYFFTQTRYVNNNAAVSAVRNPQGQMALVMVNLTNGNIEPLTEFSFNVLGYPFVVGQMIYFTMADTYHNNGNAKPTDRIFAVNIQNKNLYRITQNNNGVYYPALSTAGALLYSEFTADGLRLVKDTAVGLNELVHVNRPVVNNVPAKWALQKGAAAVLNKLSPQPVGSSDYKKSFQLFNFHSARPFANNPEFGYTFYGNNVLSSFSNNISYIYNRLEKSHGIGYNAVYAGWYPYLLAGAEYVFNRNIDTSLTGGIHFNSAKVYAGVSLPFRFIQGRTFKHLTIASNIVIEQVPYVGIGKNVFTNKAVKYSSTFFSFSNASRMARKNINPLWSQSISISYRDAFAFVKSKKLVSRASFTLPGLLTNHSVELEAAWQKRDTFFTDFFSNNFPLSRGYGELSTRRMYKVGFNYHLPLLYPDWGVGNIVFVQRIRANLFYDYGNMLIKFRPGQFATFKNRSTGAELYLDTKVWNSLPVSVGFRYSRLLDTDLTNPGAVNRWEVFLPFNIIPD
ncbi:MAG: hypothetical protein RL172_2644 [Bacteroidota bacterium]